MSNAPKPAVCHPPSQTSHNTGNAVPIRQVRHSERNSVRAFSSTMRVIRTTNPPTVTAAQ